MKKHLLISFIAFNLLLSEVYAITPEELKQLREKAEFDAEEAERSEEKVRCEAERAAQRAEEEARAQKVDALTAGGIHILDALQYVGGNPNLDVDAFLKAYNEETEEERAKREKISMALSYGFDYQLIDVILQDSDFNFSDLSDLEYGKLEVTKYLMRQGSSYKDAVDFVKDPNFDVDAFFRAEDEKRYAEQMRQAIETMRNKGLSAEEINAILADEDFDAYQFNNQEHDCLEDELREKENARQEMLRGKIEEIYLQMKLKFSDENRARHISTEQIAVQFGSEEDRLEWFNFKKAQMPLYFNWQTYLSSYPDLLVAVDKIISEEAKEKWAITHYFLHGQYENRTKYKI